jgi:hypothetical protein
MKPANARAVGPGSRIIDWRGNPMNDSNTHVLHWRVLRLAAVPVLLLQGGMAAAQANNEEVIEEIITTGTAGGYEIRKFDASYAITTVDDEAIEQYSPQITADLLKLVPGRPLAFRRADSA